MESILRGREKRVKIRKEFIKKNKRAVSFLCLSINMPGLDKRNDFAQRLFYDAQKTIYQQLAREKIELLDQLTLTNKAGSVLLLAVELKPKNLKEIMLKIEADHILGRFFDLDVYNQSNISLSRTDFNYPPRKCFICNDHAKACMRTAKHSQQELENFIAAEKEKFYNYLDKKISKAAVIVEEIAYRAVLEEIFTTPKPGLVDLVDQGSHLDMDFDTFLKSSAAIKPFFSEFFKCGAAKFLQANKFETLKMIGQKAETAMFKATKGVNTQKGIIFSFALIIAAFGEIFSRGFDFSSSRMVFEISKTVKSWTSGLVENELTNKVKKIVNGEDQFQAEREMTHGQLIYLKYGITGARGEAENGFESVLEQALPELKNHLKAGYHPNLASIQALISLISEVDDSNLLFRSDLKTLRKIQKRFTKLREYNGVLSKKGQKEYQTLCSYLKEKSLSPGGSADLLAVAHLFLNLEKNSEKIII